MKFNMAEKRAATSELNHLNWNKEEEPEQSGLFQTASAEELKKRVIKKPRRKCTTSSETEENKTVFTGFTGFKSTTSPSSVSTSKSPFSFLSKISSTTPSTTFENVNKDSNFQTPLLKNGNQKTVKDYAKLKSLNQAVVDWIKKHVEENSICILTPIFKDYENYLNEILEDEKFEKEINNKSNKDVDHSTKSEIKQKLFSFISKDNKTDVKEAESASSLGKGFSFTSNKTPTNETASSSTSNIFANIKPPSPTSVFGNSGSFKFKKIENTNTTSSSPVTGFSFTNSKPFSFGGNVTSPNFGSGEDKIGTTEEEETEEPPKNVFQTVVEEDSIYSKRCKVFVKHDGNYADRGIGTLYLKPVKSSDKIQLLVRADTNLGNILLNFILSEGLPSQRMGKNNVMIVCIPTPESEQKPTSILLRVKTGEEADELLETINKYKK